jgi:hypothetical protein
LNAGFFLNNHIHYGGSAHETNDCGSTHDLIAAFCHRLRQSAI